MAPAFQPSRRCLPVYDTNTSPSVAVWVVNDVSVSAPVSASSSTAGNATCRSGDVRTQLSPSRRYWGQQFLRSARARDRLLKPC